LRNLKKQTAKVESLIEIPEDLEVVLDNYKKNLIHESGKEGKRRSW
jgi:hypothetical protein